MEMEKEYSLVYNKWEITLDFDKMIFKFRDLENGINYLLKEELEIDDNLKIEIMNSFLKYDFQIINEQFFLICQKNLSLKRNDNVSLQTQDYINIKKISKKIEPGRITAISYSPINKLMIIAIENDNKHKVIIYNNKFEKQKKKEENEEKEKDFVKMINLITIADDGKQFLTSTIDYRIVIWDTDNLDYKTICDTAHNCKITQLFFWKDKIISFGEKEHIKIWEKKNKNNYKANLLKRINKIYSALLLDKDILVTCGYGGTIFYNLQSMKIIQILENAKCKKENVFRRINNKKLLIGFENKLTIVSIESMKILEEINLNSKFTELYIKGAYLIILKPEKENKKIEGFLIKEENKEGNKIELKPIQIKENEIVENIDLENDLPINAFMNYSSNEMLNIYKISK